MCMLGLSHLCVIKIIAWTSEPVMSLSRLWHFAIPWTVAYWAPPSMEFSRQEYWSGLPFPFSRGSSQLRDWTQVSCIAGRRFTVWATREAHCLKSEKNPTSLKIKIWYFPMEINVLRAIDLSFYSFIQILVHWLHSIGWINEWRTKWEFILFGMHRGWGSGWSLYFLFCSRSLNKEDENSCTELIGNWKYFGICYFFHWLLCSTEIRDICKTKLKCKFWFIWCVLYQLQQSIVKLSVPSSFIIYTLH